MDRYVTVGLGVLAGAALLDAALVPAIVLGGAAVLAPRLLGRVGRDVFSPAPPARRRAAALARRAKASTPGETKMAAANEPDAAVRPGNKTGKPPVIDRMAVWARVRFPAGLMTGLHVEQAVAKTITFRVIVTSVDFAVNFAVLGNPAVAAGLAGIGLVVGPTLYFLHETVWNYYVESDRLIVELPALPKLRKGGAPAEGVQISRALAKTITFRGFATVMDFSANLVVIGSLATAAGLAAVGFVVGPIVYIGHEKLWDRITARSDTGDIAVTQADFMPIPVAA